MLIRVVWCDLFTKSKDAPSGSAPAASMVTSILTDHHSSAVRGGVLGRSKGEAIATKEEEAVQPSSQWTRRLPIFPP